MKRPALNTITGRAIFALLIGLIVSHTISVLIYASDRDHSLTSVNDHWIAGQIATVIRLFSSAHDADRASIIDASNNAALQTWTSDAPFVGSSASDALSQSVLKTLLTTLRSQALSSINVILVPLSAEDRSDTLFHSFIPRFFETWHDQVLQVSVQIKDSIWLNFSALVPNSSPWSDEFVISVLLMTLVTLPVLFWVVKVATRPFTIFANAAERIGVNLDTPPLSEKGPREIVQASQALNEMQKRIRALVENRTEMFAAISHDLRTPITRLRLRAEFVEDVEQKSKMMRDLDEMDSMISSALSFARDEADGEPGRLIDIAALVLSVCDDLKDLGMDIEVGNIKRFTLWGRPVALRRALANVISNAVQYGQTAQVEVAEFEGRVGVNVFDIGPGIPHGELEQVFRPFYRLERSRNRNTGGAGLGLSAARTIARAHGGDVILENRENGGLCARILLPKPVTGSKKRGQSYLANSRSNKPTIIPFCNDSDRS